MSTWGYIVEQYGSPIKMKLQIGDLKRALISSNLETERLRERVGELKQEIRNITKEK